MLTRKQKLFLEIVKNMVRNEGYFPTVREIGRKAGLSSPATVHTYLHKLTDKGYLKRAGHSWEFETTYPVIPVVGIVPAGNPLEVFESMGEEVELPNWMVEKEGNVVGVRVQGQSMKDAYIQDGDIVVVRKTSQAQPGEMVVALLEDSSITLKRLKRDSGKYWLMPENPEYPPIHDPFEVVGKVVGVLRKY